LKNHSKSPCKPTFTAKPGSAGARRVAGLLLVVGEGRGRRTGNSLGLIGGRRGGGGNNGRRQGWRGSNSGGGDGGRLAGGRGNGGTRDCRGGTGGLGNGGGGDGGGLARGQGDRGGNHALDQGDIAVEAGDHGADDVGNGVALRGFHLGGQLSAEGNTRIHQRLQQGLIGASG